MRTSSLNYLTALLLLCLTACGGSDDSTTATPETPMTPPTGGTNPEPGLCDSQGNDVNWQALMEQDCPSLSHYRLFQQPDKPTREPRAPGFKYELSSQLFTNYAHKYRFIFLPDGKTITYHGTDTFDLPVGAVLVKSFALPTDTQLQGEAHEKLVETRLLIHRPSGWTALPYLWQDGEARLALTGANLDHSLNRQGETLSFNYHVPSRAECKLCHQRASDSGVKIYPIGLKPYLLNHELPIAGNPQNQLNYWQQQGKLTGLPATGAPDTAPDINDTHADLTARAKGYLDINCAHCHRAEGFASISGLRLGFYVDHTSFQYGICKQPPGWDGGEKGLSYDIIPGDAEHSILLYRQMLDAPKDRMPPIGRSLSHVEALKVLETWIDGLAPSLGNCQHSF
ncbi:SO2930 family diheme c-type cytochrome [Shewanella marisflavi]|uniref:SO2930 family diheme c-type cytochrome n=1 Tax=Shewanella marisflavi TaxID=260364 RepID=UPI003AAFED9D